MDELLTVILVAIALGADAFSLALGLGMKNNSRRYILRASLVVGVFHIFMPLGGVLVGNLLGTLMGKVAIWAGGMILVFLGLKMIWDGSPWRRSNFSFREARKELELQRANTISSWGGLLALGWSVSIDAFGAGIGLGVSMGGLVAFVLILGFVAALMTAVGLLLGQLLGYWIGKWAELAGGLVLVVIGVKMFF